MRWILLVWGVVAAPTAFGLFVWSTFINWDADHWIGRNDNPFVFLVAVPLLTLALCYTATYMMPSSHFTWREFLLYFLVPYVLVMLVMLYFARNGYL